MYAATTLCALHYLACTLSIAVTSRLLRKAEGPTKKINIPRRGSTTPHSQ